MTIRYLRVVIAGAVALIVALAVAQQTQREP